MFKFVNRSIYHSIVVVGCGGTGSRLVPLLAQFLKTITRPFNPAGCLENPKIFLVDDDIVEAKNLVRQNFIEQDIGKPKAVVLAERYSRAFGLELCPVVKRITNSTNWFGTLDFEGNEIRSGGQALSLRNSLVILCVDSADARKEIIRRIFEDERTWANNSRDPQLSGMASMVIDAGNEDDFGQVRLFNTKTLYDDVTPGSQGFLKWYTENCLNGGRLFPNQNPYQITVNHIPFPVQLYQALGSSAAEKSCAELDQTLAINAMMATTIMGFVQNLYFFRPMTYDCIRLSLTGANSTEWNTPQAWFKREVKGSNRGVFYESVYSTLENYRTGMNQALKDMGLKVDPETGNLVSKNPPKPAAPPPALETLEPKRKATRKIPKPATVVVADELTGLSSEDIDTLIEAVVATPAPVPAPTRTPPPLARLR